MFDPEHLSATPDNLRSLRAAHQSQEDNLRYLSELLNEIKLRFVRLDSGLADFQASVTDLGRIEAELPVDRRAERPARPSRRVAALAHSPRPAARA